MTTLLKINNPPKDKSLTHRAFFLAAIIKGKSTIESPLLSLDTKATINCLKKIGIKIKKIGTCYEVYGDPQKFQLAKNLTLNCQNSGTTIRHLIALLANSQGGHQLYGDQSLNQRPMSRIATPLNLLGANITTTAPPIFIQNFQKFKAKTIILKVASAQVKSALLLFAILNHFKITLRGKIESRDHTEKMLLWLKAPLSCHAKSLKLAVSKQLKPFHLAIPADPSSSLYYLFLFAQLKKSGDTLILPNHYLNPTRCYSWDLLKKAGYRLHFQELKKTHPEKWGILSFKISNNQKKSFFLKANKVSSVIDEIPLLMTWSLFLKKASHFEGISELKHKESNRLLELQKIFTCFGIKKNIIIKANSAVILPIKKDHLLKRSAKYIGDDHRLVMIYHLLKILAGEKNNITQKEEKIISVSNPQWVRDLEKILSC